MSVPYNINAQKEQASEDLLVGSKGQLKASEKIPMIARGHVSDRAKKTLDIVSEGCQTCVLLLDQHTNTHPNRSRGSSKKNVSPPTPS